MATVTLRGIPTQTFGDLPSVGSKAPDFKLPDYKALTVKREARSVTPEDLERALDVLRRQGQEEDPKHRAQLGHLGVRHVGP